MTEQEKNKKQQMRFIDEFQTRINEDTAREILSDDFVNFSGFPGIPNDKEGVIQTFRYLRSAFGNFIATTHDMIAENNKVFTRKSFAGKHIGDFMGFPATNKDVTINVFDVVTYKNGKIINHRNIVDIAGIMKQIGVLPS